MKIASEDWSDIGLILSEDCEVERPDDGGDGVDSKLAVISLTFIEVDVEVDIDESTEVVVATGMAAVVALAAATAVVATLRAALIFFCLLIIITPSR